MLKYLPTDRPTRGLLPPYFTLCRWDIVAITRFTLCNVVLTDIRGSGLFYSFFWTGDYH